jgi:adenine-specific DNA-methyltransferase
MNTELLPEGNHDEYGNCRAVDVAGRAMPFQKIETIDQPGSEAAGAGQLEMFDRKTTRRDGFSNRLILGKDPQSRYCGIGIPDNKLVMV